MCQHPVNLHHISILVRTTLCPPSVPDFAHTADDGDGQANADPDSEDCTSAWLLLEETLEDAAHWWQDLVLGTLLHTHRHTVRIPAIPLPQHTAAVAVEAHQLVCENAQPDPVECHLLGMGAATRPRGMGGKQHGRLSGDRNLGGGISSGAEGKDSFGHHAAGTTAIAKQAAVSGSSRCCYCLCDAAVVALFVLGPHNGFSCTVHRLIGHSVEGFEKGGAGNDGMEEDVGRDRASSRSACSEAAAQLTRLQNAAKVSMQIEVWKAGRDAS